MQNLEIQLAALEEFKSFLETFREEIGEKVTTYGNKFLALREAGLSIQFSETYAANYCNPNMDFLHKFMESIAQNDLTYLNKNIVSVKEVIDRARMG